MICKRRIYTGDEASAASHSCHNDSYSVGKGRSREESLGTRLTDTHHDVLEKSAGFPSFYHSSRFLR